MISPFDPSATRTLQDQAIDWLVKLRDDQLDDRDLDDFAEWLGQAPEHGEAFAVAEQLFNDMVFGRLRSGTNRNRKLRRSSIGSG
jgi:transmembrane sensor